MFAQSKSFTLKYYQFKLIYLEINPATSSSEKSYILTQRLNMLWQKKKLIIKPKISMQP